MSPAATRLFKIGLTLSIVIAMASVCAAVWAAARSPVTGLDEGLPIGNKRLTVYRRGADFRIATCGTVEVFLSPPASPDALREAAAYNKAWGHPQHWLDVPVFSLSLWWPVALSGVLPGIWIARRRRRHRHAVGFPVVASPRAT